MMDFAVMKYLLTVNMEVVQKLVEGVTPEQAVWKPNPDRWSILEVVNHMYDEEREDFRLHLDVILHNPEKPWPSIDPMGWLVSREYNKRDIETSLKNLLSERQQSLVWLETLGNPNWQSTAQSPWGPITAGDMFASWVIHDQWHIQQLVQLRRDLTINLVSPYDTHYAGAL